MALKPDIDLAEEFLDALYQGDAFEKSMVVYGTNEWNEFRETLLAGAIVRWLDRWLRDPQNDALRARGDPLWDAVNTVHAHLKAYVDEWWEREAGDDARY